MKRFYLWIATGLLFALSAPVFASSAYVGINLVLRAGPDIGYPRVMLVPAGSYLTVYGCLSNYTWCDVGINGDRGWVAATYLQYYYGDNWVYLPTYGPRIGVPVVTFVLGTYWDNHYRHRAWYHERDRWRHAPPRHLPPPRRTPSFHPRLPPPAHPPARAVRQPAQRQAPSTRPSGRNDSRGNRRDHRGGH